MNKGVGIALALVLLLIAAAGVVGAVLYFNKSDDESKGDRFIVPLPNNQGYAVKDGTESFVPYRRSRVLPRRRRQRSRRIERMSSPPSPSTPSLTDDESIPDYVWIERNTTLLEQESKRSNGEFECDENPDACRKVYIRTNNEDAFWLLTKLYEEVNEASLDYLRSLPGSLSLHLNHRVISENPLTIRVFNEGQPPHDFIPGVTYDVPLFFLYTAILLAYKGEGRTLPRPDPNVDYTF